MTYDREPRSWTNAPDAEPWDHRCHICESAFVENDERAEVYLDPMVMKAQAGGQDVLVDELPEDAFGPFVVHAQCYLDQQPRYTLA